MYSCMANFQLNAQLINLLIVWAEPSSTIPVQARQERNHQTGAGVRLDTLISANTATEKLDGCRVIPTPSSPTPFPDTPM